MINLVSWPNTHVFRNMHLCKKDGSKNTSTQTHSILQRIRTHEKHPHLQPLTSQTVAFWTRSFWASDLTDHKGGHSKEHRNVHDVERMEINENGSLQISNATATLGSCHLIVVVFYESELWHENWTLHCRLIMAVGCQTVLVSRFSKLTEVWMRTSTCTSFSVKNF